MGARLRRGAEAMFAAPARAVGLGRLTIAAVLLAETAAIAGGEFRLFTIFLLGAYATGAAVLVSLPRSLASAPALSAVALVADVGVLAAFVALGAGPAAHYLLLAAFVVLTATIRWQWKGALVCAGALAALVAGAEYAHLIIDEMHEPLAVVASGDAVPPSTTGSLSATSGLRLAPLFARAAEVLAFGVMFAILAAVAGRMAARSERARLARDMHDTVLQDLAAANLMLAGASSPADGFRQTIAEVSALLSEQQRRIRLMLGRVDSEASIARHAADELLMLAAQLGHQWRCTVEVDFRTAPDGIAPARAADLGLLLREAVANAVRHGLASRVRMTVERHGDTLRVSFEDDGRVNTGGAVGSASMADRVADLGGRIATAPAPGVSGIVVTVEIPL